MLLMSSVPSGLQILSAVLRNRNCHYHGTLAKTLTLGTATITPPSLVLLSVAVPAVSKFRIYQRVGTSPTARNVPVVFLATQSTRTRGRQTFDLKTTSCVIGPFQTCRILLQIGRRLSLHHRRLRLRSRGRQLRTRVRRHRRVRVRLHHRHRHSRRLLIGVLPCRVTRQLGRRRQTVTSRFSTIAVLFTSLIKFDHMSTRLTPYSLIQRLGQVFSHFSRLTTTRKLRGVGAVNSTCVITTKIPITHPSRTRTVTHVTLSVRTAVNSFHHPSNRPFRLQVNVGSNDIMTNMVNVHGFVCSL